MCNKYTSGPMFELSVQPSDCKRQHPRCHNHVCLRAMNPSMGNGHAIHLQHWTVNIQGKPYIYLLEFSSTPVFL